MFSSCKTLGVKLQTHVCNFSLGLKIKAGEPLSPMVLTR